MCEMWTALRIYQGFVRKSGTMEMLQRKVWWLTLRGSQTITLAIIMHFVKKAEEKIQKTEEERE